MSDPIADLIRQLEAMEYGPKASEQTPKDMAEFMKWFNRETEDRGPTFGDQTPYYEDPPVTPSAPDDMRLSGNMSDRRMENHPLIGKLARQKTRGERMQDVQNAGAWDQQLASGKPAKMFDDDIEATISEGRYGEYGWLDSYIEEMARIARGEK